MREPNTLEAWLAYVRQCEAAVRVCLSGIMTFPEAVWAVCVPVLRTRKGMEP